MNLRPGSANLSGGTGPECWNHGRTVLHDSDRGVAGDRGTASEPRKISAGSSSPLAFCDAQTNENDGGVAGITARGRREIFFGLGRLSDADVRAHVY